MYGIRMEKKQVIKTILKKYVYICVHTHIYLVTHTHTHARTHASLVNQLVKNPPAMQENLVQFLGQEDLLEKETSTHSNILDLGLIPGLGKSPGEGNGYPLQYSGLENSMAVIYICN